MSFRESLKKVDLVVLLFQWAKLSTLFFRFKPFKFIKGSIWFWKSYFALKKGPINSNFDLKVGDVFPCLLDNLDHTPLDPVYFFQDSWAAGKIFELKPKSHIDVGSAAKTIGIISQYVPTTMVDIRPIKLSIEGLSFKEGTILNLPFPDNSVESISSLCVVEHIGLGRYGDPIDPWGSEKAIEELKRVTKPGGHILFSVPVDLSSRIYFNAHRAFTKDYIVSLFKGCQLKEEKYIYGNEMLNEYFPNKGYGIGLFMFSKSF
jgi:hypothetical protein